ncbi:hypothetical protein [Salipiger pallidus]|nr:hypothetical protein [Salipiger pallidus]
MKPLLAALFTLAATAASAQSLYVPVIHVLQGDGSYKEQPLKGAEAGLPLSDCKQRAEDWRGKNGAAITLAEETSGSGGRYGTISVTCELR